MHILQCDRLKLTVTYSEIASIKCIYIYINIKKKNEKENEQQEEIPPGGFSNLTRENHHGS